MEGRLIYAFGHLVSGYAHPDDPHAGDSLDLARDVLEAEGLEVPAIAVVIQLAEYVADNYQYTGEGRERRRKIESGEL